MDGRPLYSIVFKSPDGSEHEEGPLALPPSSLSMHFTPDLLQEIAEEIGADSQDVEEALREAINDARTIHIVESESGIIRIVESDGLALPLSGGSLYLPDGSLAVVETTTAWAIREFVDNKGKQREVEDILPIWYTSMIKDGNVIRREPHNPLDKRVRLGPLSVKVEIQSRPRFNLETLMDVETGQRFLDGEVSRPFSEIAEELIGKLREYVVFEDPRVYSVVGSYIVLTYLYDVASVPVPRLFLLGPFGSGKTRALKTAVYSSHRGWAALNPSDASTYRMISALRPTLGVDEKVGGEGALLVLKAGYKKGEKVPRVEKTSSDTFVLSAFETYAPVIMAYTSPPREDLAQRTIIIIMVKASPKMNRDPTPIDFESLREELYLARLTRAAEFLHALDDVEREVGDEIKGRDFELWAGILAAARLMGEEHYRAVLEYAREDIRDRAVEAYSEERLILSVLAGMMGEDGVVRATTSVIFGELKTRLMGEGYSERDVEREWSLKKLGNLLRRLGFRRRTMKVGGSYPKLYVITKEELLDIAKRYGIEDAILGTLPGAVMSAEEGKEGDRRLDRLDTLDGLSEKEESEKGDEPGRSGPEKTDTGSLEEAPLSNNLSNPSNLSKGDHGEVPPTSPDLPEGLDPAMWYWHRGIGWRCRVCGAGPFMDPKVMKRHEGYCRGNPGSAESDLLDLGGEEGDGEP